MFFLNFNHRVKTCNTHAKNEKKHIKTYYQRKSLNHKRRQEEREELQNKQKTSNKMALVSPYLSIVTLN